MRWLSIGLAVVLWSGVGLVPARAELTGEQVRQALRQGVEFLEGEQRPNGAWDDQGMPTGGVTALATLALLYCGETPDEPHVAAALEYLRGVQPENTYVVALQTMVFAKAAPGRDRLLIQRNADWLVAGQCRAHGLKGTWTYRGMGGSGDNSNSQFALLGLYEAERAGAKVDESAWVLAREYWRLSQSRGDGSWGYRPNEAGRGSMVCAGIASLIIASGKVHETDAQVVGNQIKCCVRGHGAGRDEDCVERGLNWLERNFSVVHNPGYANWSLYYLYGLERVGWLTGRRFIGQHDWYREGAEFLLTMKGDALADRWVGLGQEGDPRVATSFALLFLAKGRRPILVAKLKHGESGRAEDWNFHRNDVANLTEYVQRQWQRELGWQVVDLDAASVDDLLQTPVLYLTGEKNPLPNNAIAREALVDKLRQYLERGGFLLAEASCGSVAFDEGFVELMKLVFPEPGYGLKVLPPEHPVWHAEEPLPPGQMRPLMGVEFGCRTSVVFAPVDQQEPRPPLSCLWELSRAGRGHVGSKSVQEQIDGGLALGINIMAYATNREVKYKDEIPQTATPTMPHGKGNGRGQVRLANVRHPGGCNAAPRALISLLESGEQQLRMRVDSLPQEVALTDEALFEYHMIFMHGRNRFRLTDEERAQLKLYVERGGMVLADAICSSEAFTTSFREEMATIFPDQPLREIAPQDPLLTKEYGGFDLTTVTRRDPEATGAQGPLRSKLRKVPPELEGIRIDDRYAVVFSRYDLSCALEKHDSLECQGYIPEDAARIGLNVLLYSLQQ